MPTPELFGNIPGDPLGFGLGRSFRPEKVKDFLQLKKQDVSHLADVSIKSVRYDLNAPTAVIDRFEEIATTCNTVAEVFDGDAAKTALWFRTKNPLLGDISPRDMIRLGRYDRLRRFIIGAMANNGVRFEWHLLKPFRMTMESYFFASDETWLGKQWKGFGSSFDGPGLNAPRSSTHVLLRNQSP